MQGSHEELKSANEELQSTNEELQSTNEELTTSKEEMQSLNEELQTVNAELQAKVEELSRANNDMKNLLNSTDIATVFLDRRCRSAVSRPQASQLDQVDPERRGPPGHRHRVRPDLRLARRGCVRRAAHAGLRRAAGLHRPTAGWFTARVMPYRTIDNKIDGVVDDLHRDHRPPNAREQLRDARAATRSKAGRRRRTVRKPSRTIMRARPRTDRRGPAP